MPMRVEQFVQHDAMSVLGMAPDSLLQGDYSCERSSVGERPSCQSRASSFDPSIPISGVDFWRGCAKKGAKKPAARAG
jgi:hypothetical protein